MYPGTRRQRPSYSVAGTGDERYMEDWALVELYRENINWNGFKGNMLGLGTFWSIFKLSRSRSLTIIPTN